MDIEKPLSMHLNTFRSLTEDKKIPDIAIHTFYKNLVPPQVRTDHKFPLYYLRLDGDDTDLTFVIPLLCIRRQKASRK